MNSLVCLSLLALVAGACAQVPGAGDKKSMAGGGMEAMGKMMLKAVDNNVMNKQTAEILKTALTFGLKHLDAKSQKTSGRKDQVGIDDDAKQAIEAYLKAIWWIIHHALHN